MKTRGDTRFLIQHEYTHPLQQIIESFEKLSEIFVILIFRKTVPLPQLRRLLWTAPSKKTNEFFVYILLKLTSNGVDIMSGRKISDCIFFTQTKNSREEIST